MSDVRAIQSLTSVDSVKTKRAYRRGQITKIKAKIEDLRKERLKNIKPIYYRELQRDLSREIELHAALQLQLESLLRANVGEEDAYHEECSGEEVKRQHNQALEQILELISRHQNFKVSVTLQEEVDRLNGVTSVATKSFEKSVYKCAEKVAAFRQDTQDLCDDDQIEPVRKMLEDAVTKLHRVVMESQEKSTEREVPTPTTPTIKEESRLKLDLPQFSGRPKDWANFYDLFNSTLQTRGKHLSDREKTCLLLKAMKTEEAQQTVTLHSRGDDSYNHAVEALIRDYGSPTILYPYHMRELVTDEVLTYSREGLRRFRERYLLNFQALQDLKGATLSQFLAAHAFDNFDTKLQEEWTKHHASKATIATLEEMAEYFGPLEHRMTVVGSNSTASGQKTAQAGSKTKKPGPPAKSTPAPSPRGQCPLCKETHSLTRCAVFQSYDLDQRNKVVKDHRRCTNCLHDSHTSNKCNSPFTCRHCRGRHHTLLHKESNSGRTDSNPVNASFVQANDASNKDQGSKVTPPVLYFLDTALVSVVHGDRQLPARAAIDSGAGVSVMSERLATQLKLPRYPQRILVEGAYEGGSSKHFVQATLRSLQDPSKSVTMKFSVIPKIKPSNTPQRKETILEEPHIKDLALADPDLGGPLDIIICSVDRFQCVTKEPRFFPETKMAATETIFGWTITGPLGSTEPASTPLLMAQPRDDTLQKSLERLWELDQVPNSSSLSTDETAVVQHFQDSHNRGPDGRYTVELPRIGNPPELGESRAQAVRRFQQNEKTLRRKNKLCDFNAVLQEYLELDHAEQVPPDQKANVPHFYLPLHGVFKESSSTTKVRAVFDASARTTNGVSLNDILEAGPNLYPLLPDILIRFRSHRIGLSADISKMFREILLQLHERDLHRFVMRDAQGAIQDYRMKRLTFGVKSSPYIATQVIRHLAEQHLQSHPQASQAILESFYVDDFLSGTETVQEADNLRKQLCDLLSKAGMNLRKWRTSSTELRTIIPTELIETKDLVLTTPDAAPKALGIHWDVAKDNLHVSTPVSISTKQVTKRTIASDTAKVFDVLGLFAPAIIPARVLLQSLWKLPLKWDDPVPEDILLKWNEWTTTLKVITDFAIPRRVTSNKSPVVFKSLHGFSDASSTAYGAAVYLRLLHEDSTISVALITAKARVSPVKAVTIPKAELVAAHLLAKLIKHVAHLLKISTDHLFAWTDSMIVLCWLQKPPATLKTFVANRVSDIQEHLTASHWRHVSTTQNPADLLSRGLAADQLVNSKLWWEGPPWLVKAPEEWPVKLPTKLSRLPEIKVSCKIVRVQAPPPSLWGDYSSFHHLTRIIAWIRRFTHNSRSPRNQHFHSTILTAREVSEAKLLLLRISQRETYDDAFKALRHQKDLPKGHSLARMEVSLGADKLLRVSTRVRDKQAPRRAKTLIPLSLEAQLTQLLVTTLHKTYGHPGTAALLSIIGDSYVIPGLRNFLKKISRSCAICQRAYARPLGQQMGMLPSSRTTPSPPFHKTGVDYAGPFYLKKGHTRKPVIIKTYACLFVCLTTRAVHLELCSELSTVEFMAALRRFTARRGMPADIYSDHGTNFQGAHREIRELQQLQYSQQTRSSISHFCTQTDVNWHHIPPRAPHFGGLWEAGVKGMKTLLRKLVTPHHLRFDELYTLLTEVEAILNSRPLTPLNSTNVEETTLTPGHFLIGRPLKAPPTSDATTAKISSLRRWTLVNRLSQDLWKDWLGRYLQSLYHRSKWTNATANIQKDDIVYVKDESLRYRDWPIARVMEVYMGDDNRVRAADLLCHGKIFRRSTHRLIPVLNHDSAEQRPTSSCPREDVQDPASPDQE